MKDKILLVDDEPNVLAGYKRGLRQRFDVFTAEGGEKGLESISAHGPFCVIVSDMRMPVMDGVEFLKKVKRVSPESTRMMLTGNADQETAMKAVNIGAIFRFLTKPCPSNELTAALALGIRQYKLVTAEKEILEKTLTGSVKLLTELVSISEPALTAKAEKICEYTKIVCPALQIENAWELEFAAMLEPLGALTHPKELRTKVTNAEQLNEKELEAILDIPNISSRLLANIPRLENVSELVKFAGPMITDPDKAAVPLESQTTEMRTIRILCDIVEMELSGTSEKNALDVLRARNQIYDFELVEKIAQVIEKGSIGQGLENMVEMEVRVKNLLNGDILKQNVESLNDRLLLSKGTRITSVFLARLNSYRRLVGIQEPIEIYRKTLL